MNKPKQPSPKSINELYKAVLSLQSLEECKAFFTDLCTVSEIAAMTERFQVAKLLSREISYREISGKTGASTATVTRVAHSLHHGQDGYQRVLERM